MPMSFSIQELFFNEQKLQPNAENEAGEMAATVAQHPAMIGSMGVEGVAKVLAGESLESYIPISLKLVK